MNNGWYASVWVSSFDNAEPGPGIDGAETIAIADDDLVGLPGAGALRWGSLRLTETIDDQLWPAQPRMVGRVNVLANTAAELGVIERDDYFTLGVVMDRAGAWPVQEFDLLMSGRVSEVVLRPHPLGCVADISGVDFVVSYLGGASAGAVDYPSEPVEDRLTTLLGAPGFDWFGPGFGTNPNLDDRTASLTTVLELVTRYLASWPEVDGSVPAVPISRAAIRSYTLGTGFYTFGHTHDRWELYEQPKSVDAADAVTIDAAYVDFSAEWTQRHDGVPTRVEVAYPSGGAGTDVETAGVAGGPTVRLEVDVTSPTVAQRIADLYLPDAPPSLWFADTFRYYLSRDPQTKPPLPRVGQVITIDGIPAALHPTGGTSWEGLVSVADLTIEDGDVYCDITLRPVPTQLLVDGGAADATHANTIDGGPAVDAQTDTIDGGAAA